MFNANLFGPSHSDNLASSTFITYFFITKMRYLQKYMFDTIKCQWLVPKFEYKVY